MASWEDRYLDVVKPLRKLLDEAAKADPGAVDDIEQYMGDWAFDGIQDTMVNIDQGNYREDDDE